MLELVISQLVVAIPLVLLGLWTSWYFLPRKCIGFFHPYCDGGGGGERVLWCAVKGIQRDERYAGVPILIMCATDRAPEGIIEQAQNKFGIDVSLDGIEFVRMPTGWAKLLEAKMWPKFTVLGQSLGCFFLALRMCPHFLRCRVLCETTGLAFCYPVAWVFGCSILSYTHYPTMSYDMIDRVRNRVSMYNNNAAVANNPILTFVKLIYYQFFLFVYGFCGAFAKIVLTNGNWTRTRIEDVFWFTAAPVLYPPVNLDAFNTGVKKARKQDIIVSVSQFRPEKNQKLQIDAFARAHKDLLHAPGIKLLLVGGVRNEGDQQLCDELKEHANNVCEPGSVEFHTNVSFPRLVELVCSAKVSIHTMIDEHFGINLLEFIAGDCVVVSNRSGGPLTDIIGDDRSKGILCETEEEYATAIAKALPNYNSAEFTSMRQTATKSLGNFLGDDKFAELFVDYLTKLRRF